MVSLPAILDGRPNTGLERCWGYNGPAASSIRYCIHVWQDKWRDTITRNLTWQIYQIYLKLGTRVCWQILNFAQLVHHLRNWKRLHPAELVLNPASQILSQMRDLRCLCLCRMNLLTCPLPSADATVSFLLAHFTLCERKKILHVCCS